MYQEQISSFYSLKLQKILTDPFPQSHSFASVKNNKSNLVAEKQVENKLVTFDEMKAEFMEGLRAKDKLNKAIKDQRAELVQNRLDLYKQQKKVNDCRRKIERIRQAARGQLSKFSQEEQ